MSMADTLAIVMALAAQGDTRGFNPMDLPPAGPEVTIAGSPGGHVQKFAEQVIDYDRAGTRVRVTGACVSACTLVLALPADRICVGPRASFGFHEPTRASSPGVANSDLGDAMFDTYPGFVKAWLKGRFGGLPSGRPQFLGYDVLRQHYRTCG